MRNGVRTNKTIHRSTKKENMAIFKNEENVMRKYDIPLPTYHIQRKIHIIAKLDCDMEIYVLTPHQ